ncbi:acyltransferase [Janthinobacterium sp. P210006]|uniref:acyltransferase n=1 Tax=Janthinobacterium sp. P210006 TaxID=3112939 RepID=UPI002E2594B9|nr:acyltransferase [Janthinobacterium sp. P210006]
MNKLKKIFQEDIFNIFNLLDLFLVRVKTKCFYKLFFGSIGKKSVIYKPTLIANPKNIFIGDFVTIRNGARIEVVRTNGNFSPRISIGNNVNIEQNVHIVCGSNISIGDNVSITGGVAIVDIVHPYENVDDESKIGSRLQCEGNYVDIAENVFIGYGSIIMPNVKIGKNSIIGAHSVVNVNVPAFSVVAGNPAKIIKTYCFKDKEWKKTS